MSDNTYSKLRAINVKEHIVSKGKLTYLSWAHAVDYLLKAEPTATWEVHEHEGLPWFPDESGGFVKVTVKVGEIGRTCWLPILNHSHRSIERDQINSFDVNKALQRALAKAIGYHGLGIALYTGEDLPDESLDGQGRKSQPRATSQASQPSNEEGARALMAGHGMDEAMLVTYCKSRNKQYYAIGWFDDDMWAWLNNSDNMQTAWDWLNAQVPA